MHFRNSTDGQTVTKQEIRERFGVEKILDVAITKLIDKCERLQGSKNYKTNIDKMNALKIVGMESEEEKPVFGKNSSVRDILLLLGIFCDFTQKSECPYIFQGNEQSDLTYMREEIIQFFSSQYTKLLLGTRFKAENNSGIGILHFNPHFFVSNPIQKCSCEKKFSLEHFEGKGTYTNLSSTWKGHFKDCSLLKCLMNNILESFRTAEENGAICFKTSKKSYYTFPICVGSHWSLLEATFTLDFFKQEFIVNVIHQNARASFEQEAYFLIAHVLMCNNLISINQDNLSSVKEYNTKHCYVELKQKNFFYEHKKVNRSDSMKQPVYDVSNSGVYTLASMLLDTPSRTVSSFEQKMEKEQTLGIDGIRRILLADCLNPDLLTRSSIFGLNKTYKKTKSQYRNQLKAKKRKNKALTQLQGTQEKKARISTADHTA